MKKMIFGIMIGLLIGSATTVFAATGDKIEATVVDYKLIVNGKEITVPFVQYDHDGTTLMSIRQIANMLGVDVTYKAATADSKPVVTFTGGVTVTANVYSTIDYSDKVKQFNDKLQESKKKKDQVDSLNKQIQQAQDRLSGNQKKYEILKSQYNPDSTDGKMTFDETLLSRNIKSEIKSDQQLIFTLQAQLTQAQSELTQLEREKADLEAQLQ